ncbi:hypothetical protein K8R33_00110, partial [archaeon]|nr:hypothetical protein [archaeon]
VLILFYKSVTDQSKISMIEKYSEEVIYYKEPYDGMVVKIRAKYLKEIAKCTFIRKIHTNLSFGLLN